MNIVHPDIRQLMSPMVYKVFMSQDVSGVASYNLTSNNYKKQQKITACLSSNVIKGALINSKQGAIQTHQSSEEEMIVLGHHTHRHQLRGTKTTKHFLGRIQKKKKATMG